MSQESQQAASYCNSPEFGLMDLQEDSQESNPVSNHDFSQSTQDSSVDLEHGVLMKISHQIQKAVGPLQVEIVELKAQLEAKSQELEQLAQNRHGELTRTLDRLEIMVFDITQGNSRVTRDLSTGKVSFPVDVEDWSSSDNASMQDISASPNSSSGLSSTDHDMPSENRKLSLREILSQYNSP